MRNRFLALVLVILFSTMIGGCGQKEDATSAEDLVYDSSETNEKLTEEEKMKFVDRGIKLGRNEFYIENLYASGNETISKEEYAKYTEKKQQWEEKKTVESLIELANITEKITGKSSFAEIPPKEILQLIDESIELGRDMSKIEERYESEEHGGIKEEDYHYFENSKKMWEEQKIQRVLNSLEYNITKIKES